MDPSLLADLSSSAWIIAKLVAILGLGIYTVFAFVIVRQVAMMTNTLQLGLEATLRVFAYLHFFFALILLAISIFIL
jgi:hypothetical protein